MTTDAQINVEDRCRLVLVTPAGSDPERTAGQLAAAGRGGDIASVLVSGQGMTEEAFRSLVEALVPIGQGLGAAVIAAGERRLVARAGADGVHVGANAAQVAQAVADNQDGWIIGAETGKARHHALEMGEARPDYLFFGRLDGDTHAHVHPGIAANAAWWAEFVEVPAILMAGHDLADLNAAAATGVEFVALSRAVFGADADPEQAVRQANAVLANHLLAVAA